MTTKSPQSPKPRDVRPSLSQLALKLKALRNELVRFINDDPHSSLFSTERVKGYETRYGVIVQGLTAALPTLFDDLPARTCERSSSGEHVYASSLRDIVREMDYCKEILDSINLEDHGVALRVTREGAYFAGQQFDAIRQVQEIIATATTRIGLIDNYAAEATLDLLAAKAPKVAVRMMTKPRSITPAFRAAANAFNQQYGGLSVRTTEAFHDRFVVIDGKELFHFGASIKDAGKRAFMFSRIEEPSVVAKLQEQFTSEWTTAPAVVTP